MSDQPGPVAPGDASAAVGGAIFEGVPIVGPAIRGAVDRGLAHVRALQSGRPVEEELANVRNFGKATAEAHPDATSAGNMLGAVAGMLPLATGAGAAALGMDAAAPLGNRLITGMATGGGINYLDAVARGQNPEGATIAGGVAGGALPVAGRGISWLAETPVGQYLQKPIRGAVDVVKGRFSGETMARNQLLDAGSDAAIAGDAPDAVRTMLTRNPNLLLADTSQAYAYRLAGLAQQPEHTAEIANFVQGRNQLRRNIGREAGYAGSDSFAADPEALRAGLTQKAKANADEAFRPILKDADLISFEDMNPAEIRRFNEALTKAKSNFPDQSGRRWTQADEMHQAQSQLRRDAATLRNSALGSDKLAAEDTEALRQKLVGKLDDATGGKFRPAQKQYADDLSVGEAFDSGRSWRQSKELSDHPEAFARRWQGMTEPQREAYRQGALTEVERMMEGAGSKDPATAAQSLLGADEASFARRKFATMFGEEHANKVVSALEDIRRIAQTNRQAVGGSMTAVRRSAEKASDIPSRSSSLGGPESSTAGLMPFALGAALADPITGAGLGAVARIGNKLLNAASLGQADRAALARNRLVSQALQARGPDALGVLDDLAVHQGNLSAPSGYFHALSGDPRLNLLLQAAGRRSAPLPPPLHAGESAHLRQ